MKKRILSILLVTLMVVGMFPVAALAVEEVVLPTVVYLDLNNQQEWETPTAYFDNLSEEDAGIPMETVEGKTGVCFVGVPSGAKNVYFYDLTGSGGCTVTVALEEGKDLYTLGDSKDENGNFIGTWGVYQASGSDEDASGEDPSMVTLTFQFNGGTPTGDFYEIWGDVDSCPYSVPYGEERSAKSLYDALDLANSLLRDGCVITGFKDDDGNFYDITSVRVFL